ncbi:hypothetical protein [Streptomonospora arabica]|uniref:Uncharacterized protein n=1 Tax=Streptomonospora arabica TaxID=412417 RepID=A0ABV9ST21_9ACTN
MTRSEGYAVYSGDPGDDPTRRSGPDAGPNAFHVDAPGRFDENFAGIHGDDAKVKPTSEPELK